MDEHHETYADKIGQDAFLGIVNDYFAHHYKDRGMKKWQGFFLSDHTAALKRQAEEESIEYEPLEPMPQADVRAILNRAYANHNSVEIQLTDVSSDIRMFPPVRGKVSGIDGRVKDTVVIGENIKVEISHIRNIRLIMLPGENGGPVF